MPNLRFYCYQFALRPGSPVCKGFSVSSRSSFPPCPRRHLLSGQRTHLSEKYTKKTESCMDSPAVISFPFCSLPQMNSQQNKKKPPSWRLVAKNIGAYSNPFSRAAEHGLCGNKMRERLLLPQRRHSHRSGARTGVFITAAFLLMLCSSLWMRRTLSKKLGKSLEAVQIS